MNNQTLLSELKPRVQAPLEGISLLIASFTFAAIAKAFLFSILHSASLVQSQSSFGGRLISVFALQVLALPLLIYVYLEFTERSINFLRLSRPTRKHIGIATLGTILLVALNLFISAIFRYTDTPVAASELTNLSNPTFYLVLAVVSLLIIAPAEELFFRGVIQTRLAEAFSIPSAIVLSSAIFSLPHYQALIVADGRLSSLITIFLLGCVLAAVYEYTDNLAVPILMHGVFNAIVFISAYAGTLL